jgi:hypothetical protein
MAVGLVGDEGVNDDVGIGKDEAETCLGRPMERVVSVKSGVWQVCGVLLDDRLLDDRQ